MTEATKAALAALTEWYDNERPTPDRPAERYVVCAGFAVTERMRETFPLRERDYITEKNQVRTGGAMIKQILARFGEARRYASEGGRTTRGTRTAAEHLVARLNALTVLAGLSAAERAEAADAMQRWLMDRVVEYFDQRRIEVEVDLEKPAPRIVADILDAAGKRNLAGAVAQHLVGAKLALRFKEKPHIAVENNSYTTADQQLGRPGDFLVRDTVFHVTVAPMPPVLQKCADNLRARYRAILLVREDQLLAARQMAKTLGLEGKIGIQPLEAFVGQNIEEMGGFGRSDLASGFRALLDEYNNRVAAVETNQSLQIETPENLQ